MAIAYIAVILGDWSAGHLLASRRTASHKTNDKRRSQTESVRCALISTASPGLMIASDSMILGINDRSSSNRLRTPTVTMMAMPIRFKFCW